MPDVIALPPIGGDGGIDSAGFPVEQRGGLSIGPTRRKNPFERPDLSSLRTKDTLQPGGILDKEMPLPASKVAIWNPGSKKADRIGIKTLADGKRVRFLKSNNEVLDVK